MAVLLRVAGTFRVFDDAGVEHVIGSLKARRLLALLAARRGEVVTPQRLVEALCGNGLPP